MFGKVKRLATLAIGAIVLAIGLAQPVLAYDPQDAAQLLARAADGNTAAVKSQLYSRVAELTWQGSAAEATRAWALSRRGDRNGAAVAWVESQRLSAEAAYYARVARQYRVAAYSNAVGALKNLACYYC